MNQNYYSDRMQNVHMNASELKARSKMYFQNHFSMSNEFLRKNKKMTITPIEQKSYQSVHFFLSRLFTKTNRLNVKYIKIKMCIPHF